MYYFLTAQPLDCRYVFNSLALIDAPHGEPECSGTVQVIIRVADRCSEPLETGISTTTSIFEGRRRVFISPESEALNDELSALKSQIDATWDRLVKAGHIVTSEMIMSQLQPNPVD